MKKPEDITSVEGAPEKDFFVNMLTRDIALSDSILDLLDNCVDGALRTRTSKAAKEDSLEGFEAKISFNEKRFCIEDNCGGLSWDLAKNSAFKMGKRPEDKTRAPGSIGLVGIGMKRAIFKLGRECHVHSHHIDDTFMVSIPTTWFSEDDWEFPAEREKPKKEKDFGTIIEISKLTSDARIAFREGSQFRTDFTEALAISYSLLISKGFKVSINGETVTPRPVKIRFEESTKGSKEENHVRPFFFEGTYNGVDIFFAVGYRSSLKTDDELKEDAKGRYPAEDAGWTVVCNDRVVLCNDKTALTGWGINGVPTFHNQFSSIAGIVEFKAADSSNLPLTTTKRGIDAGKEVYLLLRQKMQEATRYFTQNTNKWKGHEAEIKGRFDSMQALELRDLRVKGRALASSTVRGPIAGKQFRPTLPEKKKSLSHIRISFSRGVKEVELVSRFLFDEVRDGGDVGEACFDEILNKASK